MNCQVVPRHAVSEDLTLNEMNGTDNGSDCSHGNQRLPNSSPKRKTPNSPKEIPAGPSDSSTPSRSERSPDREHLLMFGEHEPPSSLRAINQSDRHAHQPTSKHTTHRSSAHVTIAESSLEPSQRRDTAAAALSESESKTLRKSSRPLNSRMSFSRRFSR